MIKIYKNFSPEISIVMASFNRAGFLERSIDSVLNQSFKYWELIIVDDGSSDSTSTIIDKYINQFENIRYVKHSNRKLSLTRNAGIQASVGNYITFLDSDDEYKTNHLQLRYEYISQNGLIDLLHGGVEIIGNPFVKDKNDLGKKIHLDDCTIGGTFFGKREVFLALDGFKDIPYSEDSEFFERAQKCFIIEKVGYPTYIYYRNSADGICNNI